MKSLKVYLALFALFLVFNSNLALKKFKAPEDKAPEKPAVEKVVIEDDDLPSTLSVEDKFVEDSFQAESKLRSEEKSAICERDEKNQQISEELRVASKGVFCPKPHTTIKKLEFFKMGHGKYCFSDLGVNSEGITIGVGLDVSVLYEYSFAEDFFVAIKTDFEVSNLWRVDINYDGIIYAITRCGDTYYLDCERRWVKLPGCAIDIAAGRTGDIYKIGCEENSRCREPKIPGVEDEHHDKSPSSPHIYKLVCNCSCKCCDRRCKVFIKKYHYQVCEPAEKKLCYWIRLPNNLVEKFGFENKLVEFTRLDVNISGFPIATDGKNIYEFYGNDTNKFKKIYGSIFSRKEINDVASDNNGFNFFITDDKTYILNNGEAIAIKQDGRYPYKGGSDISAGPYGIFSFIHSKLMYTVAKMEYN